MSINHALAHLPDAAVAITAPDRAPLSFADLRLLMQETAATLASVGIGRGHRVALLVPNGPEAAAATVALAATLGVAPLNPAYRAAELQFLLNDLRPTALILSAQLTDSPVRAVAESIALPCITLHHTAAAPAGAFTLKMPTHDPTLSPPLSIADTDDSALLLHTSGTTGTPKLVALTQANLLASARHIGASLALTPADRCLNIMPLIHIHGLIAAVLASLCAGASVSCTPGFNALRFFGWLQSEKPTWYTAVPTMHQAILSRVRPGDTRGHAAGLRLVRASSAPLAPSVLAELEAVFAAPVVEAYGMTEATHQMAANPLPPLTRKPGSVGVAAGPQIAILDATEQFAPADTVGEVVVRGPNVMRGYVDNPVANAAAFHNGWFRTGDMGRLDTAGYLFLTGRLKEQINRGGEKINPHEVDAALLTHPAVDQAATFAVPHAKLHEDVAAAVVVRPTYKVNTDTLRQHVSTRLSDFKVPRQIIFVDEIPLGPSGKVQRQTLAQLLAAPQPQGPRVCIFGAGAIGGLLAARLCHAHIPVTLIARGAALQTLQTDGVRVTHAGAEIHARPTVCAASAMQTPPDFLVLAVKASALVAALPQLRALVGPTTTIVAATNGIPWWYTYELVGPHRNRRLMTVDPDGALWDALPPAQTLGCVVYAAADQTAIGVIDHSYGDRFVLGAPNAVDSVQAQQFAALLQQAGFRAPVRARIRDELWVKLWGNMVFNPLNMLTGGTLHDVASAPETHALVRTMMQEGQDVGSRLGVRFGVGIEQRIAGALQVGSHKTSMLQDFERGRPLEIEAVLGAVVEMASWVEVAVPMCETVLALVRQRQRLSAVA